MSDDDLLESITPKQALAVLSNAMQSDPGYAWSWHCNIAMVAQDAGAPHDKANERAVDFMRSAFNVDTSKGPHKHVHADPTPQEKHVGGRDAAAEFGNTLAGKK